MSKRLEFINTFYNQINEDNMFDVTLVFGPFYLFMQLCMMIILEEILRMDFI